MEVDGGAGALPVQGIVIRLLFVGDAAPPAAYPLINPYEPSFIPTNPAAWAAFHACDTDRSNSIDWTELKRMLDRCFAPLAFPGNLARLLLRAFNQAGEQGVGNSTIHYAEWCGLFEHINTWRDLYERMATTPAFGGTPQVLLSSVGRCLRQQLPANFTDDTIRYILDSACEGDDVLADHAISFQAFLRIETELQIIETLYRRFMRMRALPAGGEMSANDYVRLFFYAR